MKKLFRLWPFFLLILLAIVYYWKVFFKGYVPFPGDLLVGTYEPWLESKWGYSTGVPVKNPLISDVFSQFYLWKSISSEAWRKLQIPFWNPFSYSGYPLMANFHSGVFYPLNLLHVLMGDVKGWSFLVIAPSIGSALSIYCYLRQLKQSKIGALSGAVVYAYSGFAISWSQFITAAQAMIWLPLFFLILEKYFETERVFYAYFLPILYFFIVTSGHFQILVYTTILTVFYFFWKWLPERKFFLIRNLIYPCILSLGLASIQLAPTIELTGFGLRFVENTISAHNYGLLPFKNLITLVAPDYFGNPSTYNYFGFFNYHETLFYCGILSVFTLTGSLLFLKNNQYVRFYLSLAMVSLLLGFDSPIGKFIYNTSIPGLSTSDAGRISVLFSLSMGVLSAIFISNLKYIKLSRIFVILCIVWLLYVIIWLITLRDTNMFFSASSDTMSLHAKKSVAIRNLILPGALIVGFSILLVLAKKWSYLLIFIVILAAFDMFRFGWKYLPFVPERIVYPDTPITQWIRDKGRTEIFRIDRERAEIMPPSTWMAYRFMSPSGYDPMARADYVNAYQEIVNGNKSGLVSRYSELERYDATALGQFNVKYFLAIKRDDLARIPGNKITYKLNQNEWKKVFETRDTAIFENLKYQPRVRFVDSSTATANITNYQSNKVEISYTGAKGKTMLLADSWYPGWRVYVNGKENVIERCAEVFRCVKIDDDNGQILFTYLPSKFYLCLGLSIGSLIVTIAALIIHRKPKYLP